jgi:RNA polymerase sigma-70 factor (ECF subfamily)
MTAATAEMFGIDPVEEAGWIDAVAKGDPISFRKLYERFRGVIFNTVYKVLNDREDSEDTAQEVFAQIWKKAHMFKEDRGRALTWIATMARNRAIDRLRTKQRRARLTEEFHARAGEDEQATVLDASDAAERGDTARLLNVAMERLSEEQRAAIRLVYFDGLTHAEAATRLDQPLGTIKARVRRGLAKMRDGLPATAV